MDSPPASAALPDRARVVVIGGGIIGTSVAYHLAHAGVGEVVLLERDRLTSGTTWHAAGLMATFGSTSQTSTELRMYTRDLYARLEAETGLATGLKQCGLIELAIEPGRLEEYRRVAAFNRLCGVEVHEISPREVAGLFPLARVDDVLAGFYIPADGRVNPVDVTMSLARGARMQGARIIEGVPVTGFMRSGGAVAGVRTPRGDIEAEYVVNCAGMWARELGELAGVTIPLQSAEHYYLLTEPIEGVDGDWPVLEDPASYGYYREEGGGLMLGLFEPVCAPWQVSGVPADFSFGEISPDWDRMAPYLERTISRVPVVEETGIKKLFCGPESFTPDLLPIVGEAPELRNYFVAAGLNSIGILTGGGIGRVIAHWIAEGRPDVDVTAMNIDRLHRYQANPEYRATRTVESLGMVYETHYPGRPMRTARGAKVSPIHQRLVAQQAYFRDVSGWEGADWYAPEGAVPEGAAPEAGPVLGPAGLVRLLGGRASRHAHRRDLDGHGLHGQVRCAGPRRRAGAGAGLRQPGGRRARPDHLHAVAQSRRHAGSRPHGDQARRGPVLGGRLRHRAPARRNLAAPPYRRLTRLRHGRDVGLRADQHPGPAVAGAAGRRHLG